MLYLLTYLKEERGHRNSICIYVWVLIQRSALEKGKKKQRCLEISFYYDCDCIYTTSTPFKTKTFCSKITLDIKQWTVKCCCKSKARLVNLDKKNQLSPYKYTNNFCNGRNKKVLVT